jgi:uncharacterized protein (DUF58 family)
MLTRRGWGLVVGSVALAVAGRVLGTVELYVLAAGGAGLAGAALVAVWASAVDIEATRRVRPARIHAGADSRVELVVTNRGRRRTPVVTVVDPLQRLHGRRPGPPRLARFSLAPLEPGDADRGAYRLAAERGVFRIGPLEAVVVDPFALASRAVPGAPETEVTIYPRVDPIVPPPETHGHDPRGAAEQPAAVGTGDEFYGLRPYQIGDDLRRVHWPSTARQDDLMIRQPEHPWQGRCTILLDVRVSSHPGDGQSLEQAVSAAASVVTACWKRDGLVRLVTTAGFDSGFGAGPGHLDGVMEHLAVVQAAPGDHLDEALAALRHRATGALVVLTTPAALTADTEPLARAGGRFGWVGLVVLGPGTTPAAGAARGRVVRVAPGRPFADAWNRVLAGARAGGRR